MNIRLIVLGVAMSAAIIGVAVAAPLQKQIRYPIVGAPAIETVEAAVDGGFKDKGWTVEEKQPGRTIASIRIRERHFVKVAVTYDQTSYTFNLLQTEGLNQNDKSNTIHRNYARWIAYVDQAIKARLPAPPSVYPAQPGAAPTTP